MAAKSIVLSEQILLHEAELDRSLRAELAETNKGVVALYAELDEKAAAAARGAELKSRFLSYMSHEFRTPLDLHHQPDQHPAGRAWTDRSPPNRQRQLRFVRGSVLELTEMVDDLLDLAKVEAGRIYDLARMVRDGGSVLGAARHVQADRRCLVRCR